MSTAAASPPRPHWDRLARTALIVGVVGIVLCVVGALLSPAHFFRSYLVAYNFWLGIALGCLVILMIQHLTGGAWGMLVRRVVEAGVQTLLPLALFVVPVFFGLHSLYAWAQPETVALDEELQHKSAYLNVSFFAIRVVVYFAVWLVLAFVLNRWSRQQDAGEGIGLERRFRVLSGPGLALYGGTITFASIDWVMSLEPHWSSTMFPPLFAVSQGLAGMAFAVAVVILLAERPPLSNVIRPNYLRDLGNMLLTFVMLWMYLTFSQFLLIWVENMPEETPWYLRRLRGGWEWIAVLLLLFQFTLPFLLLLFRDVKEHPRRLAAVALFVLAMYFLNLLWWIEAAFPDGLRFYWLLDLAALIGLGGLWLWWFLRCLARRPLLPVHDPYLPEFLPEGVSHD